MSVFLKKTSDGKTRENEPSFEIFGRRISIYLNNVKLLKTQEFSTSRRLLSNLIIIILLSFNITLVLTGICEILNVYDLPSFAACISCLFFNILGGFRWIYGMAKVEEVEDLIKQMQNCHKLCLKLDQNDENHKRYKKKLSNFQHQMWIFSTVCLVAYIGGVSEWCMNPVFYDAYLGAYSNTDINSTFLRHLPYPAAFPWSIDTTPKYISTLAWQTIGALTSAIGHSSFEILNVALFASACIHLEYLSETLDQEINDAVISKRKFDVVKFERELKNCLVYHQKILLFLDESIDLFTFPMFLMCVDTTMVICLEFLDASTMEIGSRVEYIMKLTSMLEYWTVTMADLFVYCYLGTKIKELGLKVSDAIYSCKWIQAVTSDSTARKPKVRINQMIQFSLLRAQKPIFVTGGLFPVLSLETFRALVGFAMSNALVLHRVSESL